jgi:hypothetical protein
MLFKMWAQNELVVDKMTLMELLFVLNGVGWGLLIGILLGTGISIYRLMKYRTLAGYVLDTGKWYCPTCDKDYTELEYYDCEHEKIWKSGKHEIS